MSFKQEKVIVIISEFVNDKREFYPITNVPVEKARFFYKDDDGLFKVMASSDYAVRMELNETRLYITNVEIKEKSTKFQVGYEINFTSSEYETSLPVLSVLVEMYNNLIEDSRTIFNYVKKQCFISDDKTTSLVLPNLPSYCVWCMGENGEMFALPVSELYSKFQKLIDKLYKEIKKLLDIDYSNLSNELRKETDNLLKDLEDLKKQCVLDITKEGEKQLGILNQASQGLPNRVSNVEIELNKFKNENSNEHNTINKKIEESNRKEITEERFINNSISSSKLKIATDEDKIKLVNLSDEVKSAMAGNTPVSPTLQKDSVVREYIANGAVNHNKIDYAFKNSLVFRKKENKEVLTSDTLNLIFQGNNILTDTPNEIKGYLVKINSYVSSIKFKYSHRSIALIKGNEYVSILMVKKNPTSLGDLNKNGTIGKGIEKVSLQIQNKYYFYNDILPTISPKDDDYINVKFKENVISFYIEENLWFEIDADKIRKELLDFDDIGFLWGFSEMSNIIISDLTTKNGEVEFDENDINSLKNKNDELKLNVLNIYHNQNLQDFHLNKISALNKTEKLSYKNNTLILSRNAVPYESVIKFDTQTLQFTNIRGNDYWITISEKDDNNYCAVGLHIERIVDFFVDEKRFEVVTENFDNNYKNYTFEINDTVYIENSNDIVKFYIKKEMMNEFDYWFEIDKNKITSKNRGDSSSMRMVLGISNVLKEIAKNISFKIFNPNLKENIINQKKYAIVCIAGQSNAVGYDESPVNALFQAKSNPRVHQLGFRTKNLEVVPLGHCAENFQDMTSFTNPQNPTLKGTKGLHLPLGKLLEKYIPNDYEVLIIPCAYGGSGFTSGDFGIYDQDTMKPQTRMLRWGTQSAYYKAMKDRIKYCLDMDSENIFLGVVWCQGENDSSNPDGHYTAFQEMTNDFFTFFNTDYKDRVKKRIWDKDIWFNMETVALWYEDVGCQKIWENYKKWNENTYIAIPRSTDSNKINGTGATSSTRGAHFGNDAYSKVVAPLVFEKLKNNI